MSDHPAPSPPDRSRVLGIAAAAGAVLLLTMWSVGQGGLAPRMPVRFLANIAIVVEILPMLAAVWLGAAGLGYPLRRALLPTSDHAPVVQLGLGMAALMGVNWLLAWAGLLNTFSAWGLCAIGAAPLIVQAVRLQRARPEASMPAVALSWMLPLVMLGLGVMLVAAACPPGTLWVMEARGYDVLSYHLQLPREWLEAGAMTGLEHNVYSYMPSLVEAAYMLLGAMQGSMHEAIYASQLFHVSLAILAAAAVGCAVARFAGTGAGVIATAVMLAVPWMAITASLAYNEMAVMAFAGVALLVLLEPAAQTWRHAAAAGALLGAATLAKLTAGVMLAVPIGLIVLLGWHRDVPFRPSRPWRANVGAAAVMAVAGLLVLAPFLVRNTAWTGNPVFPFAASVLGSAHWEDAHVERWHAGHSAAWEHRGRLGALTNHWLLNTGYGALGGQATERSATDMAQFEREGGVPVLWLAALVGAAAAIQHRPMRHVAIAMLALLILQLTAWLTLTHLQSRFLLPTLLPATVLLGLGLGRLHAQAAARRRSWWMPAAGAALVLALSLSSALVLHRQAPAPPVLLIDALTEPDGQTPGLPGDHVINTLPPDSRTYLVADNQSLLYIQRPVMYHTPFDPSPLGAMIRAADDNLQTVNGALRDRGITHVWINWSELQRLHGTYGYDPHVTRDTLNALINTGWRRVQQHDDIASLYALPDEP